MHVPQWLHNMYNGLDKGEQTIRNLMGANMDMVKVLAKKKRLGIFIFIHLIAVN